MKTVLFIHYAFPPLLWGWRSVVIAKYLSELGWQPICLCAEPGYFPVDDTFDPQKLDGLQIHRVAHEQPSLIRRCWRRVRRKLKTGEDFPDSYQDWLRPAFKKACQILDRQKIDLIYNLSPTYTTAYVAMKLKKKYGIPWAADFRDPWSTNCILWSHYDKTLIKPIRSLQWRRIKNGERLILKLADKIIYATVNVKKIMQGLYPIEAHKMEVVPSGYDELTFQGLMPRRIYPEKLVITYLGSWHEAYREPTEMLMNVLDQLDSNIEVVFIGQGAQAIHQMNWNHSTCILHLSREKAHALALGSDFLLMILPSSYQNWMASKLYTYFRIGRPILALVPEKSDATRLIQQANAGFVLSFDPVQLREQIQDLINRWKKNEFKDFQPSQNYHAQFEQKALTKRMAEIFHDALCV